MKTQARKYVALLPSALLAACGSPLEPIDPPETRSVVATVQVSDGKPQVVVPTRVVAGREFTVSVMTVGGGCRSKGVERIEFRGLRVEIEVYDTEYLGADACLDILNVFKHEVRLTFPRAGTGTVMISGRGSRGEPLVISHRVVVLAWAPPPVMPLPDPPEPKPKPEPPSPAGPERMPELPARVG